MKKWIALWLVVASLLTLATCAAAPEETAATENTPESTGAADTYSYPEIKEKLTWDAINAFPVKRSDMTTQEMRQLCVDFFRFTKTALWTPDDDWKYIIVRTTTDSTPDEIKKGTIYGGLPYISMAGGSIYRLMDYLDEETGVLDIRDAAELPTLLGSQCSSATYWAWSRVINSAAHDWVQNMIVRNGFLRVGPYTYDDGRDSFEKGNGTAEVCLANGEQVMFQSYAAMQPADGVVTYNNNGPGHVSMCMSLPHVEYTDGQIDPEKSYIIITEQGSKWTESTNTAGDQFLVKNSVDIKWTFRYMFDKSYIPFTFAEFLGTDPVEETVCTFSHTDSTIAVKELFSSTVTSNYGISDVYAIVKNAEGEEIYRHAVRTKRSGMEELTVARHDGVDTWGEMNISQGDFTVEIVVQLSTGERPTVYTGKLIP